VEGIGLGAGVSVSGNALDSAGIFALLGGQTFSLAGGYALKDYRPVSDEIYVPSGFSIPSAITAASPGDTIRLQENGAYAAGSVTSSVNNLTFFVPSGVTGFTGAVLDPSVTDGNVSLAGTGAANLTGNATNNTLTGNAGSNTINGGAGVDTAVFAGNFADYSITFSGSTVFVTEIANPLNVDTLISIENLQFAGSSVAIATADVYTTAVNATLNIPAALGLKANDTGLLGFSVVNVNGSSPIGAAVALTKGQVVVQADGSFVYLPNSGAEGVETFTYTLSNGTSTAVGNVTINIVSTANANTAPVAFNDSFTLGEDGVLNGNVQTGGNANPADDDYDPNGDLLTFLPLSQPSNGTLAVNADGTFRYTPNANWSGSDSFTYRVLDGRGGKADATASITVSPSNDDPVANDDTVFMNWNSTRSILSSVLLANDVDVEGDATMTHATFGGLEKPLPTANGNTETWTVANVGTLVYQVGLTGTKEFQFTPVPNYGGVVDFSYKLSDGTDSGTATVQMVVLASGTPVNAVPVALDKTVSVTAFSTLNGTTGTTDADGDTLTASLLTNVTKGTLTLSADGNFQYTPNSGYTGSDSFSYRVSDGKGGYDTATVTINVDPQTGPFPTVTKVYVDSSAWTDRFRNFVDDRNQSTPNTLGYPIPPGSEVRPTSTTWSSRGQNTILTWVNINKIKLAISGNVADSVDTSDFSITGVSGRRKDQSQFIVPPISAVSAQYSAGNDTTIVELSLGGNLDGGVFTLTADSNGIFDSTTGKRLDGFWQNNTSTSSGNGLQQDFVYQLRILPGDLNGSGEVESGETSQILFNANLQFSSQVANYNEFHDVNGDNRTQTGTAGDGSLVTQRETTRLNP
jgi:hypothetical protein